MPDSGHWRALVELLAPERRRYAVLVAAIGAVAGLAVAAPLVVRSVVDGAVDGTITEGAVVRRAGLYLALVIASQLGAVAVTWLATATAWRSANRLRVELAAHVLALDHEFHRAHAPGELIQRVDGDITNVSDFLALVVSRALSVAWTIGGILVVLAVIDLRILAVAIVFLAVGAVVAHRVRDRATQATVDEMGAFARLYGGIEERLTAGEDLRANGALGHVMRRFLEDSQEAMRSIERSEKAFVSVWGISQVLLSTAIALAIGGSALAVSSGFVSVGTTLLLVQYALALRKPLEELVDQVGVVQKAGGAMVRVAELRAMEPTITDPASNDDVEHASPAAGPLSLRFDGVRFDYGDGEPVLRDVDLDLAAGRTVGLVGRTGGGKSTLTRLVLRLVDPTHGRVLLGGVDLTTIPLAELRRRVAMVPQEVHLLDASVRDNVTLFDHDIDDDRVRAALRAVGLDSLAEGDLDRRLGSGSSAAERVDLSAGQQQLLAMARIWLRDPDLVVLDEATARIDPATEAAMEHAVAELVRGRTAILVAHRLSTLRTVDEVIVVDDGRIVEHGARADLERDADSRYRRMLDVALDPAGGS